MKLPKITICYRQFKDATPLSPLPETITAYYVGPNASKAFTMVLSDAYDSDEALLEIEEKLGLQTSTYDLAPLPSGE